MGDGEGRIIGVGGRKGGVRREGRGVRRSKANGEEKGRKSKRRRRE